MAVRENGPYAKQVSSQSSGRQAGGGKGAVTARDRSATRSAVVIGLSILQKFLLEVIGLSRRNQRYLNDGKSDNNRASFYAPVSGTVAPLRPSRVLPLQPSPVAQTQLHFLWRPHRRDSKPQAVQVWANQKGPPLPQQRENSPLAPPPFSRSDARNSFRTIRDG
jgi:hypothetical protein